MKNLQNIVLATVLVVLVCLSGYILMVKKPFSSSESHLGSDTYAPTEVDNYGQGGNQIDVPSDGSIINADSFSLHENVSCGFGISFPSQFVVWNKPNDTHPKDCPKIIPSYDPLKEYLQINALSLTNRADCSIDNSGKSPAGCNYFSLEVTNSKIKGPDIEKMFVDGIPAEKLVMVNGESGQILVQFEKDRLWYRYTHTFSPKDLKEALKLSDSIISTFKFKKNVSTYTNKQYGFEFKYSNDYELRTSPIAGGDNWVGGYLGFSAVEPGEKILAVAVLLNPKDKYPGTDLDQAFFAVSVIPNSSTCPPTRGLLRTLGRQVINGEYFFVSESGSGGMNHQEYSANYGAVVGNNCYKLFQVIHTSGFGAKEGISQVKQYLVGDGLYEILKTFKFNANEELKVTFPNAGETLVEGQTYKITWTKPTSFSDTSYMIHLENDQVGSILIGETSSTSISWQVPVILGYLGQDGPKPDAAPIEGYRIALTPKNVSLADYESSRIYSSAFKVIPKK